MTLTDRAVLEIDGNLGVYDGVTAAFHIREDLEDIEELTHDHLIGNRGQIVSEVYDQVTDVAGLTEGPSQRNRRSGYHLDGGAGTDIWTLTGLSSVDDPDEQWGDGSTDSNDPADKSPLDATGCSPTTKRDVLGAWLAQNRIDSTTPARLYRGEWSTGKYADSAGVFDRPIPVIVQETRLQRSADDPTVTEVSLTLVRTSKLTNLDDTAEEIVDELGSLIPDY